MTHNGYTNYETWSVISTIHNTESLYNFFNDARKEVKEKFPDEGSQLINMASILRNVLEGMMPNTSNPIWGPLVNAVLADRINLREIAIALLED